MKTWTRYGLAAVAVLLVPLVASRLWAETPVPVATVSFDFKGKHEWVSFPALPLEETQWPEAVAMRTFPWLKVKTPQTRLACVWRDTGKNQYSRDLGLKPDAVFLTCAFGPSFDGPELPMTDKPREHLALRVQWSWRSDFYLLTRLEVDLITSDGKYRSENLNVDVSTVKLEDETLQFPATRNDGMRFKFTVALPSRYKSRDEQKDPIVTFTFDGLAEPTPKWFNY